MNKFKKYCPNVWVAECDEQHEKGDIIELETKSGKMVAVEIFNHVESNCYSFVRCGESYADKKAEKYRNAVNNSNAKSQVYYEASQEGSEFLAMGEPIKVGHHSEQRHRALIQRNWDRMSKCAELADKAKEQERRAAYWENRAEEITLAMPESIEYFQYKLEKAIAYHAGLKDGSISKKHSYSLTYANKEVKELKKKIEIAEKLWRC